MPTTRTYQTALDRFRRALPPYLAKVRQARERGASEASLRSIFVDFIRANFRVQVEEVDLEHGLSALSLRGKIDALYKGIVFEFKVSLDRDRENAKEQVGRYLKAREGKGFHLGILTDAVKLEAYTVREGSLKQTDVLDLARAAPDEAFL